MIIVAVEKPNFTSLADRMLSQNYPNPFNTSTTIEYSIPERADVKLTIINLIGEVVTVLASQTMDAGT